MREMRQLSIFVASPSDVEKERKALKRVVEGLSQRGDLADSRGLTLKVVDWSHAIPAMGRPEDVILDQLRVDDWDIFVGILWHRFGTPTGKKDPETGLVYDSGTHEEFRLAYRAWAEKGYPHILMYRCTKDIPLDGQDSDQLRKVNDFWKEFEHDGEHPGLFVKYETDQDFEDRFERDLRKLLLKLNPPLTERQLKVSMTKPQSFCGGMGEEDASALHAVIDMLSDPAPSVRAQAAYTLGQARFAPEVVIPKLIEMLRDENKWVRSHVAAGLGFYGDAADSALPELVKTAKDPDANVRKHCVAAMGKIRTRPVFVLSVLIGALEDSNELVRSHAAQALGNYGADASKSLLKLIETAKDPDANVRRYCVAAMGQIGTHPDSVVLILIEALNDADSLVRSHAAQALGRFGTAAKSAVPKLTTMLQDSDATVRANVITAIRRISPIP